MASTSEYIEHSGGRTPIDADGYVTLGHGRIHAEAFRERLRCGAICDEFMREHGPGPMRYAGNVIQARIFNAS